MKFLGLMIFMALGMGAIASPAPAWPYIDVTASEVVSADPPRFRTTFDLSFVALTPTW